MESRIGVSGLDLYQGIDHLAVADGAHLAVILLEYPRQRAEIRTRSRQLYHGAVHRKVEDLSIRDGAEQTVLVGLDFRDVQPSDGMAVAVQDTLESVPPPFSGSEFV